MNNCRAFWTGTFRVWFIMIRDIKVIIVFNDKFECYVAYNNSSERAEAKIVQTPGPPGVYHQN